jgi:hypothetical protein
MAAFGETQRIAILLHGEVGSVETLVVELVGGVVVEVGIEFGRLLPFAAVVVVGGALFLCLLCLTVKYIVFTSGFRKDDRRRRRDRLTILTKTLYAGSRRFSRQYNMK